MSSHHRRRRRSKDRRSKKDRRRRRDKRDRRDRRVARVTVPVEQDCDCFCKSNHCNRCGMFDPIINGNTGSGTCFNTCGTGLQSGWSWMSGHGSSSCCGCGVKCGTGNMSGWSWL